MRNQPVWQRSRARETLPRRSAAPSPCKIYHSFPSAGFSRTSSHTCSSNREERLCATSHKAELYGFPLGAPGREGSSPRPVV